MVHSTVVQSVASDTPRRGLGGGRRHRGRRTSGPRGAVDARRPVASRRRQGARAVPRVRRGHRVSLAFPSPEWVSAYGAAINASEGYRAASLEWTHGAVALVVNPQPEIGIKEAVGIWLDLERGTCREAKAESQGEPVRAAFGIGGGDALR